MRKRETLAQKGKKGIMSVVFSRTGLVTVLLLIQVGLLFVAFFALTEFLPHVVGASSLLTVFMVLYLLNSRLDSAAKLTWMVLIAAVPVFGSLFYLYTKSEWGFRLLKRVVREQQRKSSRQILQEPDTILALEETAPGPASMTGYVAGFGCYPVYDGTQVEYFSLGDHMYPRLLEELEKAESYIFMEFFIVEEGEMWDSILEVLKRKASQGVDVRIMYDGTCEFYLLPRNYPAKLEAMGIQCREFAPVMPFVSTHYNYRDHRKIVVIDGHTGFTGGVNLADEYINRRVKYGHWKDSAIMLKGPAVQSLMLMFLQMWGAVSLEPEYDKFVTGNVPKMEAAGFVMPYADGPVDDERVGEQVYMDILNRAKRYVHIMTPYLILDDQMENAICYAARRGVEVSIILPGIPDKKTAYALAKSHFPRLLEAGVNLYTYTPGFVHAKSFVCDDREAVVGTINLDYRSLYHHFECAVYMYGTDTVADVEEDFHNTLDSCQRVTWDTIRNEKWTVKLAGFVLKAVAPLL